MTRTERGLLFLVLAAVSGCATSGPGWLSVRAHLESQFLTLCDLASCELNKEITPFQESYRNTPEPTTHHVPFFEDSYVVRALCVAYDLTGKAEYIEVCRRWAGRVIALQQRMAPRGAYYLNYGREPEKDQGDWFVADSGSVAMGVLAVAARCSDAAERDRYLASVQAFAALVLDNYAGKDGGITDGIWSGFQGEWWCSTATFGALMFLLHEETGDRRYGEAASRALDWMSRHDLRQAAPISFAENPSGVVFYCGEFYAAAMHCLGRDARKHAAALDQIKIALDWLAANQKGRGAASGLDYFKEATYMSGMPYLMYVFARTLPEWRGIVGDADRELEYVTGLLFKDGPPPITQLTTWELTSWAMMSCAERLEPGALYRSSRR